MSNIIISQLYSLFIFIIAGITIGVFFDIFRILRKSFKTPDVITYIEDIVFWIFTGLFFIFILFKYNNGELRSYILIGLIFGIIIYIITISKYFINISVNIINKIKKILEYPIKLIYKILKSIYYFINNIKITFFDKILKYDKKIKKNQKNF